MFGLNLIMIFFVFISPLCLESLAPPTSLNKDFIQPSFLFQNDESTHFFQNQDTLEEPQRRIEETLEASHPTEKRMHKENNPLPILPIFMVTFFLIMIFFQIAGIIQTVVSSVVIALKNQLFSLTAGQTPSEPAHFVNSYSEDLIVNQDVTLILDPDSSVKWNLDNLTLTIPAGEEITIRVNGQTQTLTQGQYLFSKPPQIYQKYNIQIQTTLPDTNTVLSSQQVTVYSHQQVTLNSYQITDESIQFNDDIIVFQTVQDIFDNQNIYTIPIAPQWSLSQFELTNKDSSFLQSNYQLYMQTDVQINEDILGQIQWTSYHEFYIQIDGNWQKSTLNDLGQYEWVEHYPYQQSIDLTVQLPDSEQTVSTSFSFYSSHTTHLNDYHYDSSSQFLTFNQKVYATDSNGQIDTTQFKDSFHIPFYTSNQTIGNDTIEIFSWTPIQQQKINSNTLQITSDTHFYIRKGADEWQLNEQASYIYTLQDKPQLGSVYLDPSSSNPTLINLKGSQKNIVSPDGQTRVTQSPDNFNVYVYQKENDAWSTTPLTSLTGPSSVLNEIVLSSDKQTICAGGQNGVIYIWEKQNGVWNTTPIVLTSSDSIRISTLIMSDDNNSLFIGTYYGAVQVFEKQNGQWSSTMTWSEGVNIGAIQKFILSADQTQLYTAFYDGNIKIFNKENDLWQTTPITVFDEHLNSVSDILLSADETTLYSGAESGQIRIWEKTDGQWNTNSTTTLYNGHSIKNLILSSDETTLFTIALDGGYIGVFEKQNDTWNFATSFQHNENVIGFALSPDNRTFYSGSFDRTLRIFKKENDSWQTHTSSILNFSGPTAQLNLTGNELSFLVFTSTPQFNDYQLFVLDTNKLNSLIEQYDSSYHIILDPYLSLPTEKTVFVHSSPPLSEMPLETKLPGRKTLLESPDNNTLWTQSPDNNDIYVYQKQNGQWSDTPVTILVGHTNDVHTLILSSDGNTLFSASHDYTIKVWKKVNGQWSRIPHTTFTTNNPIYNFVLSSDENTLVAHNTVGNKVYIWTQTNDMWDTTPVILTEHPGHIFDVLLSPDGNTLFSSDTDQTIKVWQKTDGVWNTTSTTTLTGHEEAIGTLVLTADGNTLFSASSSFQHGSINIWTKTDGVWNTDPLTLESHTKGISNLILSSDENTLISSSWDGTIKVWNKTNGVWPISSDYTLAPNSGFVLNIALSDDEQILYSLHFDGSVEVWTKQDNLWLSKPSISFNLDGSITDGRLIGNDLSVLINDLSSVYVLDTNKIETLIEKYRFLPHIVYNSLENQFMIPLDLNPYVEWQQATDGRFLTIHLNDINLNSKTLFQMSSNYQQLAFQQNSEGNLLIRTTHTTFDLQILSQGNWISTDVSLSDINSFSVIELYGQSYIVTDQNIFYRIVPHTGNPSFSSTLKNTQWKQLFYDSSSELTVHRTPEPLEFHLNADSLSPIDHTFQVSANHVLLSSDGQTLYTAENTTHDLKIYEKNGLDWPDTANVTLTGHTQRITSIEPSSDYQTLFTSSLDTTIRVWNQINGVWGTDSTVLTGHTSWVNDIVLSPDEQTLFSCSLDGTIRVWTKNNLGNWTTSTVLTDHSGDVDRLLLSSDGHTLFSFSKDNTAKVWTVQNNTWSLSTTLTGHTSWIQDAVLSSDNQTLFTASLDNTIRVWSATNGAWNSEATTVLTAEGDTVRKLILSPDETTLFSSSWADNSIKIWKKTGGVWNTNAISTLTGHDNFVSSLALTPDGQTLFSSSLDHTLLVWQQDPNGQWHTVPITSMKQVPSAPFLGLQIAQGQLVSTDSLNRPTVWNLSRIDSLIKNYGTIPDPTSLITSISLAKINLQWTASQDGLYFEQTFPEAVQWQGDCLQLLNGDFYITFSKNNDDTLLISSHLGSYKLQQLEGTLLNDVTLNLQDIHHFSVSIIDGNSYLTTDSAQEYTIVSQTASVDFAHLVHSHHWHTINFFHSLPLSVNLTPQSPYNNIISNKLNLQINLSDVLTHEIPFTIQHSEYSVPITSSLTTEQTNILQFKSVTIQQAWNTYQSVVPQWSYAVLGIGLGLFLIGSLVEIFLIIKWMQSRKKKAIRLSSSSNLRSLADTRPIELTSASMKEDKPDSSLFIVQAHSTFILNNPEKKAKAMKLESVIPSSKEKNQVLTSPFKQITHSFLPSTLHKVQCYTSEQTFVQKRLTSA